MTLSEPAAAADALTFPALPSGLDTPRIVVDLARVKANIARLQADLDARGLPRPEFVIVDGAPGLEAALVALWGGDLPIQRCTVHKHRNLLGHAPKRLHDELSRRAVERPVHKLRHQPALYGFFLDRRLVDVGPLRLIAGDQLLGGHDLHRLENGRIADVALPGEGLMNVPHRARTVLPEDVEYLELGVRRQGSGVGHSGGSQW